jgi:hypothetical protein
MNLRGSRAPGIVALVVGICFGCWEPTTGQDRRPADSNSVLGPELKLTTTSTRFRIGELIPLQLTFTSVSPNQFQINMARYDRSGRMNYEQFVTEPKEGTTDPLRLYFNSITGFIGGGLTSFKSLSMSPTTIELELNEWVMFRLPGKYQLSVISHRVTDTTAGNTFRSGVEVKSNTIELEIDSPDDAWQKDELRRILEVLNQDGQSAKQPSNASDAKQTALKALRYLGTEAAARELARRLRGDDTNADFQCMFGLIGSPQRGAGLDEMKKLLADPDFPVTEMFLGTMSILPLDLATSPEVVRKQRADNLLALHSNLLLSIT